MHRIRSNAHVSKIGSWKGDQGPILPLSNPPPKRDADPKSDRSSHAGASDAAATANDSAEKTDAALPPPAPPPAESKEQGEAPAAVEKPPKANVFKRFFQTAKNILFSSVFNILLIFVPVGIAMEFVNVPPYVVFAVNAIAIVPLAGLLSHATEAVAVSLGDALGALLNVTFGNAVELIIFIIALVKNEIRIVQASLVGSILANLLLILGMCFLFGGLRFREQLYNSTVTQMSACLLSLSVTSLVLPTAFHASFADANLANVKVLQLSRGSSVILLLVYILYLLFQLKSHAYMYESTPQHIIDEESHPGVLANIMNSSSSDSSSDSDSSTSSSDSNTTAHRLKKAFRRRRKSSVSSKDTKDTQSVPSITGASHASYSANSPIVASPMEETNKQLGAILSGDEADTDGDEGIKNKRNGVQYRDFEAGNANSSPSSKSPQKKKSKRKSRKSRSDRRSRRDDAGEGSGGAHGESAGAADAEPAKVVTFETEEQPIPHSQTEPVRRPFTSRTLSVRPTMPKILTATVFSAQNSSTPVAPAAPRGSSVPRTPYGLRRTNSLPDRLNNRSSSNRRSSHPLGQPAPGQPGPPLAVAATVTERLEEAGGEEGEKTLSRTSAVVLLLISTGLVALCAEFLVGSINYMVNETPISEAFIGLIILPIVGNAAEHVTAVTVASKNKMDLAIGVAVGSSIQIALFVTPVVVLLGWILDKPMSLYFTLFETVSLFVSAFIINFLILDGRSNYLEGALLMAAYVIIAVAAFYYPNEDQQSLIGGAGAGDVAVAARALGGLMGLQFSA